MNQAQPRSKPKGLLIVNTGNGKGKTTAALGVLLRAWGRDMRVGGIQFFKHENANFGELRALERMGIQLTPMGDGFTWTSAISTKRVPRRCTAGKPPSSVSRRATTTCSCSTSSPM